MSIEEMLEKLSEYQSQHDLMLLDKQSLIDSVLTPEVKAKLAEIDAEFNDKASTVENNIVELESLVKAEVLKTGKTVKGSHMMAVWNKGRISWDNKVLDDLMIVLPELSKARKEGDPFVSLKKV